METGLRPNGAGIHYTLLLRIEATGFATFGLKKLSQAFINTRVLESPCGSLSASLRVPFKGCLEGRGSLESWPTRFKVQGIRWKAVLKRLRGMFKHDTARVRLQQRYNHGCSRLYDQ